MFKFKTLLLSFAVIISPMAWAVELHSNPWVQHGAGNSAELLDEIIAREVVRKSMRSEHRPDIESALSNLTAELENSLAESLLSIYNGLLIELAIQRPAERTVDLVTFGEQAAGGS